MFNGLAGLDRRFILMFSCLVLFTLFLGFVIAEVKPTVAIAVGAGLAIFIISFVSIEASLYLLIFSMLLSPEFLVGQLTGKATGGRGVTLRLDDILLLIIGFSWFARTAIYKELGLFLKTPLNKPIYYFIMISVISTAIGVMFGRIQAKTGFFFVLKYFEYFVVYFMVLNNIKDKKQIKNWIIALFFTAAIVSIIGILQIPGGGRITAPFEGQVGEPNTLGGYLVLILSIAAGLFLTAESTRAKVLLGSLGILIIIPFLYTLSRSSYVAIIPMYLALLILSEKKTGLLITFIVLLFLGPFFAPDAVKNRVTYTFTQAEQTGQIEVGRTRLDTSTSARITTWKDIITKDWIKHPVLGYGVTGYSFVDAQYPRVLIETGLLGLGAFFFLIYSLFTATLKIYRNSRDRFCRGLSLGFLAGLIAMLGHSIGCNTFIIVRIMEPFWFLAGMVMMLPFIEMEEQEEGVYLK
jgi:hypothetical protein